MRFAGGEGQDAYAQLAADREAIDAEFADAGLPAPDWREDSVPVITLTERSPLPWDDTCEVEQRAWFARAGNQFVNSLRPRLQRLEGRA